MANFQKVPNDKSTRFDANLGRLVLMLEEKARIDLYGGGPNGEELIVGLNDPTIATVSEKPGQKASPEDQAAQFAPASRFPPGRVPGSSDQHPV